MPAPRAERRRDRLAKRDADVLDGVMLIDVEIARRPGASRSKRAVTRERARACDRRTGCRCDTSYRPRPSMRQLQRGSTSRSSSGRSSRAAHRPPRARQPDAACLRRPRPSCGCSPRTRGRSNGRGRRCRGRRAHRRAPGARSRHARARNSPRSATSAVRAGCTSPTASPGTRGPEPGTRSQYSRSSNATGSAAVADALRLYGGTTRRSGCSVSDAR